MGQLCSGPSPLLFSFLLPRFTFLSLVPSFPSGSLLSVDRRPSFPVRLPTEETRPELNTAIPVRAHLRRPPILSSFWLLVIAHFLFAADLLSSPSVASVRAFFPTVSLELFAATAVRARRSASPSLKLVTAFGVLPPRLVAVEARSRSLGREEPVAAGIWKG